jgi:hypothetical protein
VGLLSFRPSSLTEGSTCKPIPTEEIALEDNIKTDFKGTLSESLDWAELLQDKVQRRTKPDECKRLTITLPVKLLVA